jgi:membrane protein
MARWWTILGTTWRRMGEDNVSALVAGAAFQTLLTIFPALTAAVSLYGLVADRNMVEGQIMAIQGVLPPKAITLMGSE